jgi:hypothetical protein
MNMTMHASSHHASDAQRAEVIDAQIAHVWMVRTFLKHCDEVTDDEELAEVHRELYDYMLALGPARDAGDWQQYVKLARKKFTRFKKACDLFSQIQPDVSGHMNFKMAEKSLRLAVAALEPWVFGGSADVGE